MDSTDIAVSTYNKVARTYTGIYFDDDSDHPYINDFINLLPVKPYVLDIGCGPGNTAKYLLENGCEVEGIDLSDEMLKIASEKVPGAHFQHMDMRHLTFTDNTFDGILAAYSLIHIPSCEVTHTLNEFARVLKPGGYIEVITQKGEPDRIVTDGLSEENKMFYNFFIKEKLAEFLKSSGFVVSSQVEVAGVNTYNLSEGIIYTIAQKD